MDDSENTHVCATKWFRANARLFSASIICIAAASIFWCALPVYALSDASAHTPASIEMSLAEQLYDEDKFVQAIVHLVKPLLSDWATRIY
jgi:hypothetical protein